MKGLYLVGEPLFCPVFREEHHAPVGQMRLCQKVLEETQDMNTIIDNLREEYLAIICSLKKMGIDFKIVYCHEDKVDKRMLGICVQKLGCKLAGFGKDSFPFHAVGYPRDFATILPGLILLTSRAISEVMVDKKDEYHILASPYGEGGRVLALGNTMLVCERLVTDSGPTKLAELKEIAKMGINIGLLPLPVTGMFTATEGIPRFFLNDHLDRVACLIRGKDGKLHLIVDPLISTADWKNSNQNSWRPRFPEETIKEMKNICQALGIEVHCPTRMEVPYSLNLIQFPDNRVLMTNGDESVARLINEIVGEENVFKTPIPIRYFPVWVHAGIRCLVSEAPEPLFRPIPQFDKIKN